MAELILISVGNCRRMRSRPCRTRTSLLMGADDDERVSDRVRPSALWLLLAIVGGLAALAAWGITFVASAFVCSQDTSECADSHDLRDYRGRLFDYEGRPASAAWLVFSSGLYGDHRERAQTDEQGRFCVRAIQARHRRSSRSRARSMSGSWSSDRVHWLTLASPTLPCATN